MQGGLRPQVLRVMAGLGPAIHDFMVANVLNKVVDTRPKGGHDGRVSPHA